MKLSTQQKTKQISQCNIKFHLPYLNNHASKLVQVYKQKRQFDLSTTNCSLIPYDPMKDKNLQIFFHKQTIRKHINAARQSKASDRVMKTVPSQKINLQVTDRNIESQTFKTKNVNKFRLHIREKKLSQVKQKSISKSQLNNYIQTMKRKIQQNNP